MKSDRFFQGYVCAVCNYIRVHGVDGTAKEMLQSGIGRMSIADLKKDGVDESDIRILEEYHEQLFVYE